MATIKFILNKEKTIIKCSKDDYIEDIYRQFSRKINIKDDEIICLYRGNKINPKITFNNQIKKEDYSKNEMTI